MSKFFKNNEMDLTTGPLFKKLIIFSLPIFLSLILQIFYNSADLAIIGQFAGDLSLAAVGSTSSVTALLVNLFMGLSIGTNIIVARSIGAKNSESISKAVHTSLILSVILGVICMAIGLIFSRDLLILLNCEDQLLERANTYLSIIFLGAPFNIIYNFGSAILLAMGDTKKPLIYLGISGIINVSLNLIFVIVFKLDVSGVAIATIISQFIAMIFVIVDLTKSNTDCKLNFKQLKICKTQLLQVLRIGLPSGLQTAMFNITNLIAHGFMISLGESVISGHTIANSLGGFIFNISTAVAQAITAFVAQNYGAGNIKYIRKIQVTATLTSIIATAISSTIFILIRYQLFNIYTSSASVIENASLTFIILVPFYCVWALSEASTGVSKGLGSSVTPMVLTLLCTCLLRVLYFIFIFPLNNSFEQLLWVYPISWVILMILQFIWSEIVYKKAIKNSLKSI